MRVKTLSILVAVILLCSGCSITKSSIMSFFGKRTPVVNTPEALYARGAAEYQDGSYKRAREAFTRLKEEYPLHELAILAELGIADSYFSNKDYSEAENAYRDFVELHPTDENVPYAIYQTGMCHFQQIDDIDRDQTQTVWARREFQKLTARYPQSKFALLAEKMIRECNIKLAEHEFYVGNFYFKLKKYQAALTRFEGIKRGYPGVGLDLKVDAYIAETTRLIQEEEKAKQLKEEKDQKGFFRRFLP